MRVLGGGYHSHVRFAGHFQLRFKAPMPSPFCFTVEWAAQALAKSKSLGEPNIKVISNTESYARIPDHYAGFSNADGFDVLCLDEADELVSTALASDLKKFSDPHNETAYPDPSKIERVYDIPTAETLEHVSVGVKESYFPSRVKALLQHLRK